MMYGYIIQRIDDEDRRSANRMNDRTSHSAICGNQKHFSTTKTLHAREDR